MRSQSTASHFLIECNLVLNVSISNSRLRCVKDRFAPTPRRKGSHGGARPNISVQIVGIVEDSTWRPVALGGRSSAAKLRGDAILAFTARAAIEEEIAARHVQLSSRTVFSGRKSERMRLVWFLGNGSGLCLRFSP